jgi:5,10-methenyltetrahydromethanopterin hydrogenase
MEWPTLTIHVGHVRDTRTAPAFLSDGFELVDLGEDGLGVAHLFRIGVQPQDLMPHVHKVFSQVVSELPKPDDPDLHDGHGHSLFSARATDLTFSRMLRDFS